jgi:dihydroorotate dehydrogenase
LPLQQKSTEIVGRIRSLCSIPVIGCGGIMDGASARAKMEAGAALVQVYTGLLYRGPNLLREIADAVANIEPTAYE